MNSAVHAGQVLAILRRPMPAVRAWPANASSPQTSVTPASMRPAASDSQSSCGVPPGQASVMIGIASFTLRSQP